MKFRYRPFLADASPGGPFIRVYRPIVILRLHGRRGIQPIHALVDTGADRTILPLEAAVEAGVELSDVPGWMITGIGGDSVAARSGDCAIELQRQNEVFHWRHEFLFADVEEALFGGIGGLEFFTARFDLRRREFELVANESLPRC